MTKRATLLPFVLVLGACGGGDSSPTVTPTPTPTPKAIIKVLIDPNPIVAVPSGSSEYPWSFAVNIQLSDSGGVGFVVSSMQTTVTAASTGLTASYDTNAFVGVKIPAYGQETRQFAWPNYRMDNNKSKEGSFTVKLNFIDDNGFASTFDSTVRIQMAGGPVHLPE